MFKTSLESLISYQCKKESETKPEGKLTGKVTKWKKETGEERKKKLKKGRKNEERMGETKNVYLPFGLTVVPIKCDGWVTMMLGYINCIRTDSCIKIDGKIGFQFFLKSDDGQT